MTRSILGATEDESFDSENDELASVKGAESEEGCI